MSMDFKRKLPIPKEIKEQYPVPEDSVIVKNQRDETIKRILNGQSSKLLLIIGPCSADRQDSILDYLERLKYISEEVAEKIFIIPRVFTNKPRSSGKGYMGMLHQPDAQGSTDLLKGLISIRLLHLRALVDYEFTCADELLYPENFRYLSDLVSYVTVGARSVDNQFHRLVASGLNIPVGMKNPISGDVNVMINAINSARISHAFLYRGWEVITSGNELSHAVLRGYVDQDGKNMPNYQFDDLCNISSRLNDHCGNIVPVIVDTNHSNSNKEHAKQIEIALDVLNSRRKDLDLNSSIKGLMIESYLEDGRQDVMTAKYGTSITDPCLGWIKTKQLIYRIADEL